MFTGLVNGLGEVLTVESGSAETHLLIQARYALENILHGESIAVNGTCLTVEQGTNRRFSAYASAETVSHTTLGQLKAGSLVNLERALALGDRLGGHLVSGHVDCVACVVLIQDAGQSRRVRIQFPEIFGAEVIKKGSVTLDGISLTVNDCGVAFLEVNVIPETWRSTTAARWASGSRINLETDVIGKYVRHMLTPYLPDAAELADHPQGTGRISLEFLRENGFF